MESNCLKGFQDFLPEQQKQRLAICNAARKVAEINGFVEISTPTLEKTEVLLGEGGETDKQVYTFTDAGGRSVGLRYDLTIPFARYVAANYNSLNFPLRKLHIGEVFRGEKPQKGRYRQFLQCDLDIIGADSIQADIEVLSAMSTLLKSTISADFKFLVGNRKLLNFVIQTYLDLSSDVNTSPILIAIDKLEKIGSEGVKKLLCDKMQYPEKNVDQLLKYLENKDANGNSDLSLFKGTELGNEAQRLKSTIEIVKSSGHLKDNHLAVDLSMARGLAYYTGIVVETILVKYPSIGSICSGGRYNHLTERFRKDPLPGVGLSLGIDRLLAIPEVINMELNQKKQSVFIAPLDENIFSSAMQLASNLREKNIRTELAIKVQKVQKLLNQAKKKNFSHAIVFGENESKLSKWNILDLQNGNKIEDCNLEKTLEFFSKTQ